MNRIEILRKSLKDKKGVELTLNTVIISILVVLVLVILIGFLLGGTGKAKDQITELFGSSSSASSVSIVIEQCKIYCDQIKDSGMTDAQAQGSLFCTKGFKLDTDGVGGVDIETDGKTEKTYNCGDQPLFVTCPSVTCS